MAKTTQTDKVQAAFQAFDPAVITDQVRELTEKSIEQSAKAYNALKENADAVQKAVEQSLESARTTGNDLSRKTLSAFRANTEAGFDHLEALTRVTSFSQLIEVQSAFLRRQSEASLDQFKEVQTAAAQFAEQALKPLRDVQMRPERTPAATAGASTGA